MTRTMAVLGLLLLAGCSVAKRIDAQVSRVFGTQQPFTVQQAETQCSDEPFVRLGVCIEHSLNEHYPNWTHDQQADLAQVYIAWLNAAGARVASGSMTEVDARLGAATIRSRLRDEAGARNAALEADRQARFAAALAGVAIMQAAQPQSAQPATTVYVTRGSQIVCSDYGRTVVCN